MQCEERERTHMHGDKRRVNVGDERRNYTGLVKPMHKEKKRRKMMMRGDGGGGERKIW